MKNFLRLSLLANILLCSLVCWLVRERQIVAHDVPAAPVQESQSRLIETPAPAEPPAPTPFRWSQLESSDYHTYLANLRNIGCPEQTIRDIITADVDSLFAQRREEVEHAAGHTPAELQLALQGLREQEAAFLASLFGDAAPSPTPSTNTIPRFLAQRTIRPVMPLALQEIDPASMQLNSNQVAIIASVRQQFQAQLGNQDTNDPAYVQRWNKAQRDADDTLRGLLGSKFFIQYRLEASKQASSSVKN